MLNSQIIMNHQLIEKVIKLNTEQCPEFVFTNPLLDRNVASALSKSYVKFLRQSNHNVNANSNIRLTVLTNIRKMCKTEPENHLQIDENFTNLLSDCYFEHINKVLCPDSVNKTLDGFLIRKLKDINSNYEPVINPEIIQALINMNENVKLKILSNSLLHWNMTNKHSKILHDLWTSDQLSFGNISNDISIKIKSEIESYILDCCHRLLVNRELDVEFIFSIDNIKKLVKKCSVSPHCFQICCSIINYLFIKTNFDHKMQTFILQFVNNVKLECLHTSFSVLYSNNVTHLVVLLDFDINILPCNLKESYIEKTLYYLHRLHTNSESDLILLLSHFPQWFDIYFKNHQSD